MINFKNIWSRANWGLIVYQGDTGKSVYANNYAKQTLNAPEIEFCVFDMITEPKRSNVKYLNKDLLTSESFSTEICFKKLDGQFIYAELGTMPVEGEENLFAIMFKDITYQLKLRRDLMAKQDEITKTY